MEIQIMWGAIAAGAVKSGADLIGGLVSSAAQAHHANKAQKDAQQFAWLMARNRYKMTMADLERSGLNPMLAIGGATPNVPSPMASFGMPSMNLGSGVDTALAAMKQKKEREKLKEETRTQRYMADYLGLSMENRLSEQYHNALYAENSARHMDALRAGAQQDAFKKNAERKIMESMVPAAESAADLYRRHPKLRWIDAFTKSLGLQGRDIIK